VVQAGYELNVPLRVGLPDAHKGPEAREASFLRVDAPNVIVEAVKKAEDSDGLVLRLYECEHKGTRATLHFGFPLRSAVETNLMEEDVRSLDLQGSSVLLEFKPFEIKTLRVSVDRKTL
jgi:alpha-mannosidase